MISHGTPLAFSRRSVTTTSPAAAAGCLSGKFFFNDYEIFLGLQTSYIVQRKCCAAGGWTSSWKVQPPSAHIPPSPMPHLRVFHTLVPLGKLLLSKHKQVLILLLYQTILNKTRLND
jgi:hypothetical protein